MSGKGLGISGHEIRDQWSLNKVDRYLSPDFRSHKMA